MQRTTLIPTKVLLLIIALSFHLSCTKDSDLLAEYVLSDEIASIEELATNNNSDSTDSDSADSDSADSENENSSTNPGDSESPVDNQDNTNNSSEESNKYTLTGLSVDSFGAAGDGITDDTNAIQAAFDSGSDLYFSPEKIYRVTAGLDLDKNGNQLISGNEATLLVDAEVSTCINLSKGSGTLTLNDFNVNANSKGEWVFRLNSSFVLDNVNVENAFSDDQAAIGFYIAIKRDGNWSKLELLNCSVDNVVSEGNGVIGDNIGAARALVYDYLSTPSNLNGIIDNCDFRNVFGEDGDVFHFRSNDQNWNTQSNVVIRNTKFETATRRVAKIFAGNIKFYNCTFTNISRSHPNFRYALETGGFISLGNTAGEEPARRVIFDTCTFNGSDYDNRIIQSKSTDISIINSTWNNGTEFRMWRYGGGVCLRNNSVSNGSKVYTTNDFREWYGPMVVENNANASESFHEYLSASPPSIGSFVCPN